LRGVLVALVGMGLGCDESDGISPPTEADFYESVHVTGGKFSIGFANGTLHSSREIEAFSILKHPVTVGQFRACVAAGACQVPREEGCLISAPGELDRPNYRSGSDHVPITCVEPSGAAAYCAWLGAALPTLEEWMVAARGPAIRRFAWGDAAPSCDQHPRGTRRSSDDKDARAVSCEPAADRFEVGKHPQGASTSAMEDVLLTQGELLRGTHDAPYLACRRANCSVYGLTSGAIDSVHAVGLAAGGKLSPSPTIDSFRCAWKGEVKKP